MEENKFNLDLFRSGDGLLTQNKGGFFGNRIEKAQYRMKKEDDSLLFTAEQASFTHIEVLIIRDTKNFNKFWSIKVAPPKAKLVNFPEFYKGRYVKIVRYKNYESFDKLKDVAVWAATHVNVPYDWPGIVKFLFVWIKQHISRWFCSENFVWSHQQVYLDSFKGLLPHKAMPAHGLLPEYTDIIWEGYLTENQLCQFSN